MVREIFWATSSLHLGKKQHTLQVHQHTLQVHPSRPTSPPPGRALRRALRSAEEDKSDFSAYVRNVVRQADCPQGTEVSLSTQGARVFGAPLPRAVRRCGVELGQERRCEIREGILISSVMNYN